MYLRRLYLTLRDRYNLFYISTAISFSLSVSFGAAMLIPGALKRIFSARKESELWQRHSTFSCRSTVNVLWKKTVFSWMIFSSLPAKWSSNSTLLLNHAFDRCSLMRLSRQLCCQLEQAACPPLHVLGRLRPTRRFSCRSSLRYWSVHRLETIRLRLLVQDRAGPDQRHLLSMSE
jgi:hypothetical protein